MMKKIFEISAIKMCDKKYYFPHGNRCGDDGSQVLV